LTVTLYTKADCGLCREAEVMLRRLQPVIRFELEIVDIDADDVAHARYWARIPVVAVDGEEVVVAPLDERRLVSALRR
jgi:glutaredoxin